MSVFSFKQFQIHQEGAPFKVGTDSMVLGSWVKLKGSEMVLDIGTGTGILALMLAQKLENGKILALEPNRVAFEIAVRNFNESPFHDKIIGVNGSLQEVQPNSKFDLIIANPPYFRNSTLNATSQSTSARHTVDLSFEDIAVFCSKYLNEKGSACIVLPVNESIELRQNMASHGLHMTKELLVKDNPTAKVKRVCMEFSFEEKETQEEELILKTTEGKYSPEYQSLTKEYHVHF